MTELMGVMFGAGVGADLMGVSSSLMGIKESKTLESTALETKSLAQSYSYLNKQNLTVEAMNKKLQEGEAHQAVTGAKSNSPSFQASQENIINMGDTVLKNQNVSNDLAQQSIDLDQSALKVKSNQQMIQSITGGATGLLALGGMIL